MKNSIPLEKWLEIIHTYIKAMICCRDAAEHIRKTCFSGSVESLLFYDHFLPGC
jgi:hypothetical protein